jgi:hypothetical protein
VQESPGSGNRVGRSLVVRGKYSAKSSRPKSEKTNVAQRTDRNARGLPTGIGWNPFTKGLPAGERLLQVSRLRERNESEKNGDSAGKYDAFFCARKLS